MSFILNLFLNDSYIHLPFLSELYFISTENQCTCVLTNSNDWAWLFYFIIIPIIVFLKKAVCFHFLFSLEAETGQKKGGRGTEFDNQSFHISTLKLWQPTRAGVHLALEARMWAPIHTYTHTPLFSQKHITCCVHSPHRDTLAGVTKLIGSPGLT